MRAERGFHDEFIEMFEDVLLRVFLAAPPRRDGRQFQFLPEQMLAESRQKRHERRALQEAAAERVGDGHVARAHRFNEAGHAQDGIIAQFERVAKIIVHAAQNHVHPIEAAQRFQEDVVVAHQEVGSLDQHVAQVAGEIRLLEIRFVVRAGREHHDAARVLMAGHKVRERVLHVAEESGQAMNVIVAEGFGQDARRGQAVRQRVARPGGNLCAVGNHPPLSVRRTREVGGVEMQKRVRRRTDAVARAQKIRLGEHECRRKPA